MKASLRIREATDLEILATFFDILELNRDNIDDFLNFLAGRDIINCQTQRQFQIFEEFFGFPLKSVKKNRNLRIINISTSCFCFKIKIPLPIVHPFTGVSDDVKVSFGQFLELLS